jgi:serine/threonine-protein kinase HipA
VLLLTNADRVGAMVFAEHLPMHSDLSAVDPVSLDALADAVRQLEFALEISPTMRRLLQRGGTLGGARPKATFIYDALRWMAKFPACGDEYDVEILEAATLALARQCGIEVPQFFVQPIHVGHALLLRRFDRQGTLENEQRIHFLSASALLDVPYESSGGSYVELAQTLRFISADPAQDLHQLYRRLIFNLVIDNSDDHVKNHGVLRVGNKGYRLSPAFDLVPQLNNIGYQQLAILPGRFESRLDLAREGAQHFGISPNAANAIIEEISTVVRTTYRDMLSEQGADKLLIDRVHECMKKQAGLIAQ